MFSMDDTGSPLPTRPDSATGVEMCFSPPRPTVSYPKVPTPPPHVVWLAASLPLHGVQSKIKILLLEGVSEEAVNMLKQEGFNVRAASSSHCDLARSRVLRFIFFLHSIISRLWLVPG
jgi:hypothetical protein